MNEQEIYKKLESIEKKMTEIHTTSFIPYQTRMSNDEIDLRELWNVVWDGKWVVIGITFLFGLSSILYALSLPNIYRSEVLLAPAEENSGGALAGLSGQFGGLASLAGVNLAEGGGDKTALAIEVLKSREFISKFIKRHNLLIPLMAAEGWDLGRNELIIDSDIFNQKTSAWVRKPKPPYGAEPSAQEAHKAFSKIFSVSQDKKSSFVSISVEHYSPYIAKQWVGWLVEDINDEIKSRDVSEAKKSVEYLSSQLSKTSIADMQSIFYELIEEQTKTIMFAEVREEYVFKTIDEAIAPELKSKPKKSLICILGVILGGMIGVFYVLVRHFVKRN